MKSPVYKICGVVHDSNKNQLSVVVSKHRGQRLSSEEVDENLNLIGDEIVI